MVLEIIVAIVPGGAAYELITWLFPHAGLLTNIEWCLVLTGVMVASGLVGGAVGWLAARGIGPRRAPRAQRARFVWRWSVVLVPGLISVVAGGLAVMVYLFPWFGLHQATTDMLLQRVGVATTAEAWVYTGNGACTFHLRYTVAGHLYNVTLDDGATHGMDCPVLFDGPTVRVVYDPAAPALVDIATAVTPSVIRAETRHGAIVIAILAGFIEICGLIVGAGGEVG
jgi:hypothetical protein